MGADIDRERTLPGCLAAQARQRGGAAALWHKHLGRWRGRTWREVDAEVTRLAASLAERGFGARDRLVIATDPQPEGLLSALAAQRLGGAAAFGGGDGSPLSAGAPASGRPCFVLVHSVSELDRLLGAHGARVDLAIVTDEHSASSDATGRTVTYDALVTRRFDPSPPSAPAAVSSATAFEFLAGDAGRAPSPSETVVRVRHAEAFEGARVFVSRRAIHADHDALAPASFTPDFARALVGAWLTAGFRLHFAESPSTRDLDRREIAPSIVLGTADAYAGLRQRVTEHLPPERTLPRRLVDWAMGAPRPGLDRWLRGPLGHALVRRPLREVMGFSRVELPLVAGTAPQADVAAFFSALGLELRMLVEEVAQ